MGFEMFACCFFGYHVLSFADVEPTCIRSGVVVLICGHMCVFSNNFYRSQCLSVLTHYALCLGRETICNIVGHIKTFLKLFFSTPGSSRRRCL